MWHRVTATLSLGQHGGPKGLHHTPPIAIGPCSFTHEGTEPWAIASALLGRHLGLGPAPAVPTPALMQDPMRYLHRYGGQFQHLMRVVWPEQGKRRVATRTPLRLHLVYSRGGQQRLTMAWMTRFAARFAGRC